MRRHAALVIALFACTKPDPLAPCRGGASPSFTATPPACTDATCRACVDALVATWRRRDEPDARARFRVRFHAVSAEARDAFLRREHPDGRWGFEHCTAGVASGARCAHYSAYCIGLFAEGLRSGSTSLADRTQLNLAAARACPAVRSALVTALTRCEAVAPDDRCDSGACAVCTAGHLAAMSVLAPAAEEAEGAADMQATVEATPEPVARSIAETLGAPDAPGDLETVVVQRALRQYCFSLVARSASAAPYACNGVMVRFLTHPEYGDAARAWTALTAARAVAREPVLGALLVEQVRLDTLAPAVLQGLRALPDDGTVSAITHAMQGGAVTDGAWRSLRDELVRRGVTGQALPPVNRPSTPSVPAVTPSPETSGGRGLVLPGLRAPGQGPSREG